MAEDDDKEYVTDAADMAVFDRMPIGLRKFLDSAPAGIPATPVLELYDEGLNRGLSPAEAEEGVKRVLVEYMKREGIRDFRPLRRRSK
jgi:hypothetical protein